MALVKSANTKQTFFNYLLQTNTNIKSKTFKVSTRTNNCIDEIEKEIVIERSTLMLFNKIFLSGFDSEQIEKQKADILSNEVDPANKDRLSKIIELYSHLVSTSAENEANKAIVNSLYNLDINLFNTLTTFLFHIGDGQHLPNIHNLILQRPANINAEKLELLCKTIKNRLGCSDPQDDTAHKINPALNNTPIITNLTRTHHKSFQRDDENYQENIKVIIDQALYMIKDYNSDEFNKVNLNNAQANGIPENNGAEAAENTEPKTPAQPSEETAEKISKAKYRVIMLLNRQNALDQIAKGGNKSLRELYHPASYDQEGTTEFINKFNLVKYIEYTKRHLAGGIINLGSTISSNATGYGNNEIAFHAIHGATSYVDLTATGINGAGQLISGGIAVVAKSLTANNALKNYTTLLLDKYLLAAIHDLYEAGGSLSEKEIRQIEARLDTPRNSWFPDFFYGRFRLTTSRAKNFKALLKETEVIVQKPKSKLQALSAPDSSPKISRNIPEATISDNVETAITKEKEEIYDINKLADTKILPVINIEGLQAILAEYINGAMNDELSLLKLSKFIDSLFLASDRGILDVYSIAHSSSNLVEQCNTKDINFSENIYRKLETFFQASSELKSNSLNDENGTIRIGQINEVIRLINNTSFRVGSHEGNLFSHLLNMANQKCSSTKLYQDQLEEMLAINRTSDKSKGASDPIKKYETQLGALKNSAFFNLMKVANTLSLYSQPYILELRKLNTVDDLRFHIQNVLMDTLKKSGKQDIALDIVHIMEEIYSRDPTILTDSQKEELVALIKTEYELGSAGQFVGTREKRNTHLSTTYSIVSLFAFALSGVTKAIFHGMHPELGPHDSVPVTLMFGNAALGWGPFAAAGPISDSLKRGNTTTYKSIGTSLTIDTVNALRILYYNKQFEKNKVEDKKASQVNNNATPSISVAAQVNNNSVANEGVKNPPLADVRAIDNTPITDTNPKGKDNLKNNSNPASEAIQAINESEYPTATIAIEKIKKALKDKNVDTIIEILNYCAKRPKFIYCILVHETKNGLLLNEIMDLITAKEKEQPVIGQDTLNKYRNTLLNHWREGVLTYMYNYNLERITKLGIINNDKPSQSQNSATSEETAGNSNTPQSNVTGDKISYEEFKIKMKNLSYFEFCKIINLERTTFKTAREAFYEYAHALALISNEESIASNKYNTKQAEEDAKKFKHLAGVIARAKDDPTSAWHALRKRSLKSELWLKLIVKITAFVGCALLTTAAMVVGGICHPLIPLMIAVIILVGVMRGVLATASDDLGYGNTDEYQRAQNLLWNMLPDPAERKKLQEVIRKEKSKLYDDELMNVLDQAETFYSNPANLNQKLVINQGGTKVPLKDYLKNAIPPELSGKLTSITELANKLKAFEENKNSATENISKCLSDLDKITEEIFQVYGSDKFNAHKAMRIISSLFFVAEIDNKTKIYLLNTLTYKFYHRETEIAKILSTERGFMARHQYLIPSIVFGGLSGIGLIPLFFIVPGIQLIYPIIAGTLGDFIGGLTLAYLKDKHENSSTTGFQSTINFNSILLYQLLLEESAFHEASINLETQSTDILKDKPAEDPQYIRNAIAIINLTIGRKWTRLLEFIKLLKAGTSKTLAHRILQQKKINEEQQKANQEKEKPISAFLDPVKLKIIPS